MTFSFIYIYIYFIAVYSKFTCSDYELCLPTNYNVRRILRETRSILQLLLGPKSVESVPSGEGATPAQGCRFWFTARYTRDVFMPREIQHSFLKNVGFLSSLPELGKIYVNQAMFYSFKSTLRFQLYKWIKWKWYNGKQFVQWTDWRHEFREKVFG